MLNSGIAFSTSADLLFIFVTALPIEMLFMLVTFDQISKKLPSTTNATDINCFEFEKAYPLRSLILAQVITIARIQELVATTYMLRVNELLSKNNSRYISQPRQVGMYLCKHLTKHSYSESATLSAVNITPPLFTQ